LATQQHLISSPKQTQPLTQNTQAHTN